MLLAYIGFMNNASLCVKGAMNVKFLLYSTRCSFYYCHIIG